MLQGIVSSYDSVSRSDCYKQLQTGSPLEAAISVPISPSGEGINNSANVTTSLIRTKEYYNSAGSGKDKEVTKLLFKDELKATVQHPTGKRGVHMLARRAGLLLAGAAISGGLHRRSCQSVGSGR